MIEFHARYLFSVHELFINQNITKMKSEKYLGDFEMDNGDILHAVYYEDKNEIVFGSACNAGLIPDFFFECDECLSLDLNLQNAYEQFCEMNI